MGAFDSYTTFKTAVADWLNRDDLTDRIPDFIESAENVLQRDSRVRRLVKAQFDVDEEEEDLPTAYRALEGLYHDGGTYFGEIEIVSPGYLSEINRRNSGSAGVPSHAAIVDSTTIRFAPPPDDTYNLRIVYWQTVPHLSDSALSNWLLDEHGDLYLYATLVESAPYLRDEERLPMWEAEKEKRIEALHVDNETRQYSGLITKNVPALEAGN